MKYADLLKERIGTHGQLEFKDGVAIFSTINGDSQLTEVGEDYVEIVANIKHTTISMSIFVITDYID